MAHPARMWMSFFLVTLTYLISTSIAVNVPLRILPLGDSITEGFRSSDGNGWRLALRNALIIAGNSNVEFIGTQENGQNNDQDRHEGYGNNDINQISNHIKSNKILSKHPNIILIHAGTNDMKAPSPPPEPYDDAPNRLGALIDQVLCECSDAAVFVAKVINDAFAQDLTNSFNAKIDELVYQRLVKGYRVRVVDQTNVGGPFLIDGLHPNDLGYAVMAQNWFKAIQDTPEGWILPPRDAAASILQTCSQPIPLSTSTVTSIIAASTTISQSDSSTTTTRLISTSKAVTIPNDASSKIYTAVSITSTPSSISGPRTATITTVAGQSPTVSASSPLGNSSAVSSSTVSPAATAVQRSSSKGERAPVAGIAVSRFASFVAWLTSMAVALEYS